VGISIGSIEPQFYAFAARKDRDQRSGVRAADGSVGLAATCGRKLAKAIAA